MVVLLVEDEEAMGRVLEKLLIISGFECKVVGSGEEALEILDERKFDLFIVDIALPGMDGKEFLKTCREKGYKQPAIGISGNIFIENERREIYGFDSILMKPMRLNDLLNMVKSFDIKLRHNLEGIK